MRSIKVSPPYFRAALESHRSRLRSRSLSSAVALLFATMPETEYPPKTTAERDKLAGWLATTAAAVAEAAAAGLVNSTWYAGWAHKGWKLF